MVNRKFILEYFSSLVILLVVFLGCTKDINLITEVEFELTEQYDDEGYISEPLPTNLTIMPEETLAGWDYSYSYTVESGSGYFQDASGKIIPAGDSIEFDPLTAALLYVGEEKGNHTVKIIATDSYGRSEEKTLRYTINDVPILWTVSPTTANIALGDSIAVTLVLSSINEVTAMEFEARIRATSGSGSIRDNATGDELAQDVFSAIALGTYTLNVNPNTTGDVGFDFLLRDNNGQELTATLNLSVEQISYILIPDAVFEERLIIQGFDSDGEINGRILQSDAESVTKLIMNGRDIADLTGIEGFTELTDLEVYSGLLNTVDLSKNINLEVMNLGQNNLSEIDLSNNLKMKRLYIGDNPLMTFDPSILPNLEVLWLNDSQLTEIDVSQNPKLRELHLNRNELRTLDISNNPLMEELVISDNQLIELDLSQNNLVSVISAFRNQLTALNVRNLSRLTELNIISNQLSVLDVSQNPELTLLNLNSNNLQKLDLMANPRLITLNAANMNLTEIDFSNNRELTAFALSDNDLTEIDLSNNPLLIAVRLRGNNLSTLDISTINELEQLFVSRNPSLSCIKVTDVAAANANTEWEKDATTEYRLDCN